MKIVSKLFNILTFECLKNVTKVYFSKIGLLNVIVKKPISNMCISYQPIFGVHIRMLKERFDW